jgi:microsomal dipeptidase-like Zn-dependent dipeptidase
LYLTLVHMTQYPLTNHCYGMKLIKGNDEFKPSGFGLRTLGKQIIDLAYRNRSGEHQIYIDIKHMSLVARRQFYAYRKEKGYDKIPILATHMGLTGISWSNMAIAKLFNQRVIRKDGFIEVSYDRPPGIGSGRKGKTHFNPWSINLYDEEIIEIIESDGLIGISMDQRILGRSVCRRRVF